MFASVFSSLFLVEAARIAHVAELAPPSYFVSILDVLFAFHRPEHNECELDTLLA